MPKRRRERERERERDATLTAFAKDAASELPGLIVRYANIENTKKVY
jgi:hypothetical protein